MEFRFVVDDVVISYPLPKEYIDYYLSRTKRIRHDHNWFLIECEPGTVKKNKKEISPTEAKDLIKNAILIIKKKGVGYVNIDGIEGWSEYVNDELQIEFECPREFLPKLEKKLKPKKIIKVGLFDYFTSSY